MLQNKPHESYEEASRRAFEYHVRAAPVVVPIVSLCLAGLMWWSPPSVWFVLFGILGGVCLTTSWVCQMKGKVRASLVAALASVLVSLCGLWLDHERNFNFQFTQGLCLLALPLYIFAGFRSDLIPMILSTVLALAAAVAYPLDSILVPDAPNSAKFTLSGAVFLLVLAALTPLWLPTAIPGRLRRARRIAHLVCGWLLAGVAFALCVCMVGLQVLSFWLCCAALASGAIGAWHLSRAAHKEKPEFG